MLLSYTLMERMSKNMNKFNRKDKKILGGHTDTNIIEPIQHKFAWEAFKVGNANHWLPSEINMQEDIDLYKSGKLTDEEVHVLKRSLGFFSTADSIVVNNIVLAVYRHVTSPECRVYLLRQAYEEAIHTMSYQLIIESLGLDQEETYNMYKEVPSVQRKAEWAQSFVDSLNDRDFDVKTIEDKRRLLKDLVAFYMVFEGIFFYVGFAQVFSMARRNRMRNTSEQFQYILRDETMHFRFGVDLINTIKTENAGIFDKATKQASADIIEQGAELEIAYAYDTMPNGLFGLKADEYASYIRYIADRRAVSIGLKPIYNQKENPFPWMSEMIDLQKEVNFFEGRVRDYQTGGALEW